MFSAFANSFKIKELRQRILMVFGIVALTRIAASIPCPGVDPKALSDYFKQLTGSGSAAGGFLGMFDLFTGGALENFAVATLGIMPYISASIIMQLLMPVIPSFEKMAREGESGRQRINQYTRYLTVIICIVQGTMAAMAMINPGRLGMQVPSQSLVIIQNKYIFVTITVIMLTAGTMFIMWLGEQITRYGIGNGASLIITVNIVARMPSSFYSLYDMAKSGGINTGAPFKLVHVFLLILIFVLVTAATIMLTQGQRKIPLQMAKRIVGFNKMTGGSTYIPLKINFSGVMPIIFASAIMMFPQMLFSYLPINMFKNFIPYFSPGHPVYMLVYGMLILVMSYFWVANMFNPLQVSENLKKEGAFIPGIRPGKPTAEFLDHTMTIITFAGAIFLTFLALFPTFLYKGLQIPYMVASFFGGTSLLIIVGVMLDTLSQMESHLLMRNYDGFLKKGKLKGRR